MNHTIVENFDVQARTVLAWIERYLSDPRAYPVLSTAKPGEISSALPAAPPEEPEPFDAIFADFENVILPGITHWNHPRFFAYFSNSSVPVAVLAEALAGALNVNAMLWRTSPAATELEDVVLGWLRQLLGLPEAFHGIIYDTASIAGFTALAAAREALGLDIRERGMAGRDIPVPRVYITAHTHSHIEKGAIALGIGRANVVAIPCDDRYQMDAAALEAQIEDDLAGGFRPMCIVGTIGTTSMTSVDPTAQLARIAKKYGVWLHVDAAYAGVAAMLEEHRHLFAGVEEADSLVVNPHKWLFVPMDLCVLYVRDPEALRRTFSLVADYLQTSETGVHNYMDYGLQLGRRFRALKLWFVLRTYGARGVRERIRAHIGFAAELARWIDAEPGWELSAPHPFSVVCFRYCPPSLSATEVDARNTAIMERVNATGQAFLSSTQIDGKTVLRIAIGNAETTLEDVRSAWDLLRANIS
ncbi:MAG: aminotransferase class I/II-fold pyridoxal phosphate-dependent enzyme [Candidatus Eremiobacteraeota bacterium]|nr:aminotransferase class I/II-fold pyridoxal phosphate-dependent enzyme [Candidatus Eremiobacteraeota bacterium]